MKNPLIALAGNPNSGKSTLFNALTGKHQIVGNWPGVTVERTIGSFQYQQHAFSLIDLPGTYSLCLEQSQQAIDERIACESILSGEVDLVVNVIDATNIQRHLYLTAQLLEMGVPVLVVVNKLDVMLKKGVQLDLDLLADRLGVPVVGVVAQKAEGLNELKYAIQHAIKAKIPAQPVIHYPDMIAENILSSRQTVWQTLNQYEADHEDADIDIADARFSWATQLSILVLGRHSDTQEKSRLDDVVLHRIWGIPIFLAVMYFIFSFSINIGGLFQDFFDITSTTIFVDGTTRLLDFLRAPQWVTSLLAHGAGRGISTTLTFVPVIGSMFLMLAFLESSGYMARAAFVVDRAMRFIGLPGKSFVPMIVGFGCNVPGIMAARTLENRRDRILTIMMSPFMSCGARLAIYAVFTAAFFPVGGQNVVFALYLIGILMAVLTGLLLRKTVLRGDPGELVMEMPSYHWPKMSLLLRQCWFRLQRFVTRAGKLIVLVCMLLGALNHIATPTKPTQSLLATVGKIATPLFSPMGIQKDNWPATVGLVSGVMAKEVVVGTLNTLYSQDDINNYQPQTLTQGFKQAFHSIGNNVTSLPQHVGNPMLVIVPTTETSSGIYGEMYRHFGGQIPAFAYLLFVLLYFPCISATAAMARELNMRWAAFSVAWTTGVAYACAVSFYQLATLPQHMIASLTWVFSITAVMVLTVLQMKRQTHAGAA